MLSKQSNRYRRGTQTNQFNEDIEEERMVTCDSDFEDQDVVNQENLSQREVIVDTEQSEFRILPRMDSFESMCQIEND